MSYHTGYCTNTNDTAFCFENFSGKPNWQTWGEILHKSKVKGRLVYSYNVNPKVFAVWVLDLLLF